MLSRAAICARTPGQLERPVTDLASRQTVCDDAHEAAEDRSEQEGDDPCDRCAHP